MVFLTPPWEAEKHVWELTSFKDTLPTSLDLIYHYMYVGHVCLSGRFSLSVCCCSCSTMWQADSISLFSHQHSSHVLTHKAIPPVTVSVSSMMKAAGNQAPIKLFTETQVVYKGFLCDDVRIKTKKRFGHDCLFIVIKNIMMVTSFGASTHQVVELWYHVPPQAGFKTNN